METIVIQETDQDILEILYSALELEGFRVYALPDRDPDFLEVIDQSRPHVVVLDYRMSGEDSRRLCREIKTRYAPAGRRHELQQQYQRSYDWDGFDNYIPKPFDLDLLYQVLRKHIPKQ